MDMSTLKKNHRKRERLFSGIFIIAMVLILSFLAIASKYELGIVVIVTGVLSLGIFFLALVRKFDVRVICKNCGFDLSNVIYHIKDADHLFCPKCGNKHI